MIFTHGFHLRNVALSEKSCGVHFLLRSAQNVNRIRYSTVKQVTMVGFPSHNIQVHCIYSNMSLKRF
jgi:hypothetical protein